MSGESEQQVMISQYTPEQAEEAIKKLEDRLKKTTMSSTDRERQLSRYKNQIMPNQQRSGAAD
ncbi:MAG: hypothetical protein QG639_16 [Patescibacteria group bacterium]|nr:hypothetical protein [Patescibacteria group bacterium]